MIFSISCYLILLRDWVWCLTKELFTKKRLYIVFLSLIFISYHMASSYIIHMMYAGYLISFRFCKCCFPIKSVHLSFYKFITSLLRVPCIMALVEWKSIFYNHIFIIDFCHRACPIGETYMIYSYYGKSLHHIWYICSSIHLIFLYVIHKFCIVNKCKNCALLIQPYYINWYLPLVILDFTNI